MSEAIPLVGDAVLAADIWVDVAEFSEHSVKDAAEGAAIMIEHGVKGTTLMDDAYQKMYEGATHQRYDPGMR